MGSLEPLTGGVVASKQFRSLLLVLMDAIFLVAIIDLARLVVMFFGELAGTAFGEKFIETAGYLVIRFGIHPTANDWGGVLDWDTAVMVAVLLLAEVIVGMVRRRS